MTTTMKAAVVPALGAALEIRQVPIPEPGPGQVLVRMEASGLCHTDIHAARGDWPVKPTAPFIPGHEGVGIVEALGPGASVHRIGERVAIAWLGSAWGACSYCLSGWETLCEKQQNSGYSLDGAYAEYAVVDDKYVVSVPAGITPFDAAPRYWVKVEDRLWYWLYVPIARIVNGVGRAPFALKIAGNDRVRSSRAVRAVWLNANEAANGNCWRPNRTATATRTAARWWTWSAVATTCSARSSSGCCRRPGSGLRRSSRPGALPPMMRPS